MKKKLMLSFFLQTFLILAIFLTAAGLLSYKSYENQLNKDLRNIVSLIRIDRNSGISNEAISYKYSDIGYLSVINQEGRLISSLDTGLDRTDKLLSRVEVREAIKTGEGSSIRRSETYNQFLFYKAYTLGEEILIIAIPIMTLGEVFTQYGLFVSIVLFLAIGLAMVVSYLFYKNNIRPILILERFVRRTYNHKAIGEVDIQTLPKELKVIADLFKETSNTLSRTMAKEAEKKLYLLSTINTMEDGFIAVDEQSTIKLINKSAMKLFGLTTEDILYENILIATQNLELNQALENSGTEASRQEIGLGDKLFKLNIYPLPKEKGKLILLHDITTMRKLENMRKEFVSNVSHELKTPLTSIRGFIDTLKGGALEDPSVAEKFIDIIDVESLRLESLIGDLLALSNIEENKTILKETIGVNQVAREVFESHETLAARTKIVLKIEMEEGIQFKGNPELFKALLINLVSNAIKYNREQGEVLLRIVQKKKNLHIEVKDTGIGIGPEDLHRVFERFYKVDKSRSLDHESTGLGLAIVKHIVELFNGEVQVESELGIGTAFLIKLPLKGE